MGKNVYLNGKIIPADEAKISVNDRGFLYGDALFETLRSYKKAPFMLKSHLTRLLESAQEIGFSMNIDAEAIKKAVYEVVEANDIEDGSLRITLTRGDSEKRALYEQLEQPNLLVTLTSLNTDDINSAGTGVKAISGSDKRSAVSNHKNNSMLASVMSYKEAMEKNAFDMIQITKRGFVTEGTRSNVFIVLDGILLTPPSDNYVLPGITRKVVLNIAQKNGIKVEEDAIVGQDLPHAEEMFLTNSLYEIVPVTSFNEEPIANGSKGEITQKVQNAYKMLVDHWLEQIYARTGN